MPVDESDCLLSCADFIKQCDVVKTLNHHKAASGQSATTFTNKLFSFLFPSSPAINALLATLYISGPPNFLLALCPPNIDPSSLSIMVAFAVGGLLGDTLFHLLPEIFLGEDHIDKVKFVMLEPNRNLLLGVGIMAGFLTFVAMDKGLRIVIGGHSHEHDHGHGEKPERSSNVASATGSQSRFGNDELKHRHPSPNGSLSPPPTPEPPLTPATVTSRPEPNPSVKMSGMLNLIADFTHNITDGLALSSSFYASRTVGATTTVAVFFHEIPHEVGDFALLIQSGFSKKKAMGAQFVTALGALLGTIIGIVVQESGGSNIGTSQNTIGIFGTSLTWGDMLLPWTCGTFLFVGTVAVIPELLETGPKKGEELRKTAMQFLAMFLGAGIMLGISWS